MVAAVTVVVVVVVVFYAKNLAALQYAIVLASSNAGSMDIWGAASRFSPMLSTRPPGLGAA